MFRGRARVPWRSIRFMRRGSGGMWSRCLLMLGSSWGGWISRMWIISRGCLPRFPLTRRVCRTIRALLWGRLRRFTIICDCCSRGRGIRIATSAGVRWSGRRCSRLWMRCWDCLRAAVFRLWLRWCGGGRASTRRCSRMRARRGSCVCG